MRTGIIYRATSPSGKIYIGQTKETLAKRKARHLRDSNNPNYHLYNSKFSRAIRKYRAKIVWATIDKASTQADLDALEKAYIALYNSFQNGYNCNEGGGGNKGYLHSEESKLKMRTNHPDVSGAKNPMAGKAGFGGKKHTPETIEKMKTAREKYLSGMRIGKRYN